MNGHVAQAVALTLSANAHLVKEQPFTFDYSHSTAKYEGEIRFIDLTGPGLVRWCRRMFRTLSPVLPMLGNAGMIASDPAAWVSVLRKTGVRLLRLHYVPRSDALLKDRYASAFVGGGGRWLIETSRESSSDYWEAGSRLTRQNAKDKRVWTTSYCRVVRNDTEGLPPAGMPASASAELKSALVGIRVFAAQQGLSGWVENFERALHALEAEPPVEFRYYSDLVPPSFTQHPSRRLLSACEAAWVFGGMGSWNDLLFKGETQRRYEELSDNLYSKVCFGIASAVNGFVDGS